MDLQLVRRMKFITTVIVMGATICLMLHTAHLSIGLLSLLGVYIAIVLIRDYFLNIQLHRRSGFWFLCVQLALALVICIKSESFFGQIYLLVLIGEFTFHQSRNHSIMFTAATYISIFIGVVIYRDFPTFEQIYLLIPRVVDYVAIFGVSLLARIAFHQKNQLAKDNEQLRLASIELERKAKLQERTRISREIHDSVGHTLTAALTGLQTASHAMKKQRYAIAEEMLGRSMDNISRGLADVRSSVHLLRDNFPDHTFIPELIRLIEETVTQTGVKIEYDIDGAMPDLTPMIELTVYRALQEGLTNGIRHGSSTYFHFSLSYDGVMIRFVLSDNGDSPIAIVHGYGLSAMKGRVQDAGGELSVAAEGAAGGVTLQITIPFSANHREE
ncbi:sensor histidine kinase [Paenibacillus doosanensis]|uniref:sensor histidine kinase n=1 Tax=Paenibacillus doosanensis TaxID=1229154 RepID=UPI00217FE06C|nr:sensor histidine kinase [Paenibacillus doosanensis]MCS7463712.1 sensor histidine kinase [Paenibacillus doosanensis]